MKKQMIRCASFLLAALMTVPTFASCGGDTADTTDTAPATDAQTEVETVDPNDRSQIKDTLPDNLDFGGRTFGVYCSSTKRNEEFFAGLGEETGEVVEDAVYRRNLSVQERLNIVFQSDSYDYGWKDIGGEIQKLVMAGDTTYDLFMGAQAGVTQLVTENVFINAYDLEYIDFSQPWWNNNFMNELSVGSDYRFYLSGDFFMDALFWTRAVFFNKKLYADYYDDADELYREVLDGKWTMDRMAEISKAVYVDLNNNGVSDADDQLGFGTYLTMSSSDPFVYGSDIEFTTRDAEGFIELQMMSDDAVKLAEKLVNFFYQEGSYFNFDGDAPKETVFIEGRMMFLGNSNLGSAKNLRDMKDDFGFLPYPKFDEEQTEYKNLVHDSNLLGCISASSANLDMVGACLEAFAAETYRSVTPAWYETALKVKYSRDDLSTQMIDMIRESATTNFIYAYNYAINGMGLIYRDLVTKKKTDFASALKSKEKAGLKNLEKVLDVFRGIEG